MSATRDPTVTNRQSPIANHTSQIKFIPRHIVRPDLAEAVEPEPESLVEISEARPFSVAIETQILFAQRPCMIDGPSKQRGRDTLSGMVPPHRQAMDEAGVVRDEIGPEQMVVELEFQRPRDVAVALRDMEEAGINFCRDAILGEFVLDPHRGAVKLRHPLRGVRENRGHGGRIFTYRLPNPNIHVRWGRL